MAAACAKSLMVAAGCNRTAQAVDSVDERTVAYGMGHYIGVFGLDAGNVHDALRGHAGRVNCVRFARSEQGAPKQVLVSGSADTTARIWQRDAHGLWLCTALLQGHTGAVVAVDALEDAQGQLLVATASTDSTVRLWKPQLDITDAEAPVEAVQVLETGVRCAIALAMTTVASVTVLATGNTDARVHVYTKRSGAEETFAKRLSLEGHEDWVTSLAFHRVAVDGSDDNTDAGGAATAHWRMGDAVLASASQDRHVRLWRMTAHVPAGAGGGAQGLLDAWTSGGALQTRTHVVDPQGEYPLAVTLDAVLAGHDGWVHSVAWRAGPQLATASGDGSALVWAPDAAAGVWTTAARLGGGNGLMCAAPAGASALVASGYAGGLYAWREDADQQTWVPVPAPSGHTGAARDVCWDNAGRMLLTASADQTARVFALAPHGWREVARPQVHGYDMRCAAFVDAATYVSGADEKVARVFRATQAFADAWQERTGQALELGDAQLAAGASLPVLGLSNKAVAAEGAETDAPANDTHAVRQTHTAVAAAALPSVLAVPLEEHLQRATLWPEADKLYAHAFEVHAVAASADGALVATACRATSDRHAAVRLYTVKSDAPWPLPAALPAHSLTVTRMRFSPDGQMLLTASRDRSWALFHLHRSSSQPASEVSAVSFDLAMHRKRAHARIVWDAAWAPGGGFFATASRDRTVKLWRTADLAAAPVVLAFPESVTAVDFVPVVLHDPSRYVLAAALESGRIFVLTAQADSFAADGMVPTAWTPAELPVSCSHVASVNRLAWRPYAENKQGSQWLLASASDDGTTRINQIDL
ncbi:Elongator subunit elp2 [Coemansia sp. Benny D115]|nr:Elongator subunit elp2 [Coemansia sp. Benny D115]